MILPSELKRQIGEATRALRTAVTGPMLAQYWDCDPSNITHAQNNGGGEIKKVVLGILAADQSRRYGTSDQIADEGIEKVIRVIAHAGGYHAYKPISRHSDLNGLLEAVKLTLSHTSGIIEKINDAMDEQGPLGKEISQAECEKICNAGEDLIETMLALKEFVQNNQK